MTALIEPLIEPERELIRDPKEIVRLVEAGSSLRGLREATGYSHEYIRRIYMRETGVKILDKPRTILMTFHCEHCGKANIYSYYGGSLRRFCDHLCAQRHRLGMPTTKNCKRCGKVFPYSARNQVYCSTKCRRLRHSLRPTAKPTSAQSNEETNG